jgi:hypothetical protein
MKKIYIIYAWIMLTVVTTLGTAVGGSTLLLQAKRPLNLAQQSEKHVVASREEFTPSLGQVKGIETTIGTEDARVELVANFLQRHDSPLEPYDQYAKKIVDIADKYGVDFRLIPAIAMQESNLCKKIPEGSYNCLGFGIHSEGTLTFDSYEANFDRAAKELKKNYIDQGRTTPEDIMRKYTPSSPHGAWAESVKQWMAEMRYDDRDKGRDLKTNANLLEFVEKK